MKTGRTKTGCLILAAVWSVFACVTPAQTPPPAPARVTVVRVGALIDGLSDAPRKNHRSLCGDSSRRDAHRSFLRHRVAGAHRLAHAHISVG
jgi:hypothetical protein